MRLIDVAVGLRAQAADHHGIGHDGQAQLTAEQLPGQSQTRGAGIEEDHVPVMDELHGLQGHLVFLLLIERSAQGRGVGLVIFVREIGAAPDAVELANGLQLPQVPAHRFLAAPQKLTEGGNVQTALLLQLRLNFGKPFDFQHIAPPMIEIILHLSVDYTAILNKTQQKRSTEQVDRREVPYV